jgi:hypothetical protein
MSRTSVVSSLFLISILTAQTLGESSSDKTTAIPLDRIWAYKMPGTRDIKSLSKNVPADELDMRLLNAALELSYERAERMKFKDVARPGFAIPGNGRTALHTALAVFIDWGARRNELSSADELTIAFFSEPISRYAVQIRQVTRKDNVIEIQYELVPDTDRGSHVNFALIPIGKLPVGTYRVELRQLPRDLKPAEIKMGFKTLDEEWSRNFLSKPFSFIVTEKRE